MDLSTNYLGLKLKSPIIPSSSPLSIEPDAVKQMEDAGAGAVVLYSLFEEVINHEQHELDHHLENTAHFHAEAGDYFPEPEEYESIHAEEYLEHINDLKNKVKIPVIASLNGVSAGGWMNYAKKIQDAGADALELNIYYIPTDINQSSQDVEEMYLEDIRRVHQTVDIPVTVKTGPYFSSFANMASRMIEAGANGLTLFNRFYQPDIDLDTLEVEPHLILSTPYEMRLPLRWLAILHNKIEASLAATTGIHTSEDIIKVIMAGADVAMVASVLFQHGIGKIADLLHGIERWMIENDYHSIEQMKGSISHQATADASAYERANYMRTLLSYR